jgi:hypothetical protein
MQADRMMALLEVIALNTTVLAGQFQKGSPLSDDEIDQCSLDLDATVLRLLDRQLPMPNRDS